MRWSSHRSPLTEPPVVHQAHGIAHPHLHPSWGMHTLIPVWNAPDQPRPRLSKLAGDRFISQRRSSLPAEFACAGADAASSSFGPARVQ
jgi:hypothetical protein